jgi:hypothetical protein
MSAALVPMLGTLPGQSGWYRMDGGDVIQFEVANEGGEAVYKQIGEPIALAAWQAMKASPRANASKVRSAKTFVSTVALHVILSAEDPSRSKTLLED